MNITTTERYQPTNAHGSKATRQAQGCQPEAETGDTGLDGVRQGLRDGEFVLHYQPKVNMRSGEVIGVEALIRWVRGAEDLIPPSRFLPLIENTPVQFELDQWVLERAFVQIESWRSSGLALPVSVNISAQSLQDVRFVERLDALQCRYPRMPMRLLELEVLESSAIDDLALVAGVLQECRSRGMRISLDDFGTGYASLAYVKDLPADNLKLDQSFVRGILEDPRSEAIVGNVLALAKAFGLKMVAEGVETLAHGHRLLSLGCEYAQGYGIARPMPGDRVSAWLRAWQCDPLWVSMREAGYRIASFCRVARHPPSRSMKSGRTMGAKRQQGRVGQGSRRVERLIFIRARFESVSGASCNTLVSRPVRPSHSVHDRMGGGGWPAGAQSDFCRGAGVGVWATSCVPDKRPVMTDARDGLRRSARWKLTG